MGISEAIHTFDLNGRQFTVLWKESATYLRADGRMWWAAAQLDQDDAIEMCRLQAELMVIQEREGEIKMLDRLYEKPARVKMAAIIKDYERFKAVFNGSAYHLVWAPFNQNTYLRLLKEWRFVGCHASREAAVAQAQEYLQSNPQTPGEPPVYGRIISSMSGVLFGTYFLYVAFASNDIFARLIIGMIALLIVVVSVMKYIGYAEEG